MKKAVFVAVLALYTAVSFGENMGDNSALHIGSFYKTADWRKVTTSYTSSAPGIFKCGQNGSMYQCYIDDNDARSTGQTLPEIFYGTATFSLAKNSSEHCTYKIKVAYNPAQYSYYYDTTFLDATPGIKCDTEYGFNGAQNIWFVNT